MAEIEIVTARCPVCGIGYSSWDEEEATKIYYERHHCLATLADKQIHELMNEILEGKDG